MLHGLKKKVQNFMTARCYKEYSKELSKQRNAYDTFMRQKEEDLRKKYEKVNCNLTARVVTKQEFRDLFAEGFSCEQDILIVIHEEGVLNSIAKKAILAWFAEHEEYKLLYADEDVCFGSEKALDTFRQKGVRLSRRCYPNFKPVPSPETFLSYQYFGNIWAVRTQVCREISCMDTEDVQLFEYDLLLKVWEKTGTSAIGHIPEILYHKFVKRCAHPDGRGYTAEEMEQKLREEDSLCWGFGEKYFAIKEEAAKRRGVDMKISAEGQYGFPVYGLGAEEPKVSILIPSKDNPEVLHKCIASVYEKSTYRNFEIIVVDNGSEDVNRCKIEETRKQYPFIYLYQPMVFNYSVMNNIAAARAEGSVLLLLNDDMEVVTPDWLERMVGQVLQEGVGAVGAKLLYPDTALIQHVGITNAVDGPVHKLLKMDDTRSYYKGRNKLVYNLIGVTGACLMVKRADFNRLGGLKENLRVAYNDVDFCFSLYELGLRNVIRNDVVLYHHESLSRGADVMSAEKMQRLKVERDYLYHCHPQFYCYDPYEGSNNSGGEDFNIGNALEWKEDGPKPVKADKDYTVYPAGIHVGIDRAEKDDLIKAKKDIYVVQGYAVLAEADNCRYTFEMVFTGDTGVYSMPICKRLRPNMSAGFPNATNLDLCGFLCMIASDDLPKGEYHIGIYTADRCSRQKLFQDTGRMLVIE